MNRSNYSLSTLLLCSILVASAAETADKTLQELVGDYFAKKPTKAVQNNLSLPEALKFQERFVGELSAKLGPRVGYKVGLVTKETQKRYNVDGPVRGVLLRDMVLKDGAEIPSAFGARPLFEADLIVVVKDERINSAQTPLEAAQSLSELVAFIELPDALTDPSVTPSGSILVANNVGARLGVIGQRIPLKPTREFVDALANMSLILTDQTGKELVNAKAKVILGHPLNAVIWLAQDLAASGQKLKAGDFISLGSVAPPLIPQPGQAVKLRYEGLPEGPLTASVRFK